MRRLPLLQFGYGSSATVTGAAPTAAAPIAAATRRIRITFSNLTIASEPEFLYRTDDDDQLPIFLVDARTA